MKNFFEEFEPLKPKNYRVYSMMYLIVAILEACCVILWISDLILGLAKGYSFGEVLSMKTSILSLMGVNLCIMSASFILFFLNLKQLKREPSWKTFDAYRKEGESLRPVSVRFYEEDGEYSFSTGNHLWINQDDILADYKDGFVKMIFTWDNEEYYILLKKEDYEALFMNRGVGNE